MIIHNIAPIYNSDSKILILGSFPSVKSREEAFFYAHKQNRFWKVLASVFDCDTPKSIEEKKALLINNHTALWDVVSSCEIQGSSDSSITNVEPNDISEILSKSNITCIFTNGKKADELYRKLLEEKTGVKSFCLPSTSPANAQWSLERLSDYWRDKISAALNN